jgi:hypothetical protein
MPRIVLLLAVLALAIAMPAAAQLAKAGGAALKVHEVKAALFGIDMQGYSPTSRMEWRECIQPDGETLYETPAGVMKGRLLVSPAGEACFSYEDDDYSTVACFRTYRNANGLRFEDDLNGLFVTTRIVTGVKNCKPRGLIG